MSEKYCMCEEVGGVARDGKSTCIKCGGVDAYGAKGRRKIKDKDVTDVVKKEYTPYAYLCPLCCTILECPCFVDKVCPECGCDKPDILYLDIGRWRK